MIFSQRKNGVVKKNAPSIDIRIEGERLFLRPPTLGDWQKWADVREKNRDHLSAFEPEWPENCLEASFFQRRLAKQGKDWAADRGYSFLIFKNEGTLIGGVNINNVVRGAAHFASFGYWLDQEAQGNGYMREALQMMLQFSSETLVLHRMNAACVTDNDRSAQLLLRLGFKEEGLAEKYLHINGVWQDHRLFGLTLDSDEAV